VNDLVTVADAASLDLITGMTLEAWVNPTAVNADYRTVVLKERTNGLAYALYATDGAGRPPAGYINVSSDIAAVGTSTIPLGNWTHLATTFDGTDLRLYVNGALARTTPAAGVISVSSGALGIGGNSVWGEYFSGLIDEVRIYNRALNASEIQSDMDAAISGGSAPVPSGPPEEATLPLANVREPTPLTHIQGAVSSPRPGATNTAAGQPAILLDYDLAPTPDVGATASRVSLEDVPLGRWKEHVDTVFYWTELHSLSGRKRTGKRFA
jgi:hypothetical protein